MKNLMLSAGALALFAASSTGAIAQDYGHDRGRDQQAQHGQDRGRDQEAQHGQDRGQDQQSQYGHDRGRDQQFQHGQHRGWGRDQGTNHRWRRGERMGYSDWNSAPRVDYRRNHLSRPPRGYEWRQQNGQYILGAIATGMIASIIMNSGR